MIVLPKFLFLFQNIPILIKKSFFKKLNIIPFKWGNKSSRIGKTQLQRPKSSGGMALPNFLFYYWACNIQKLIHWVEDIPIGKKPDWVHLEISSGPNNLTSIVCAGLPLLSSKFSPNVTVNNSIRILTQFRRHFGLQRASTLSPVESNYMCTPSCIDATFTAWSNKGIRTIQDMFIEDVFASFLQLSQTYDLPKTNFFCYLQIRSFVQKIFS